MGDKMKYVTEVQVSKDAMPALKAQFADLGISAWAEKYGFEAFLVRQGVCFKGRKFATIGNRHGETDGMLSVSFNGYESDGWDIEDVIGVEFRV